MRKLYPCLALVLLFACCKKSKPVASVEVFTTPEVTIHSDKPMGGGGFDQELPKEKPDAELIMSFSEPIYFGFDSAEVSKAERLKIGRLVEILQGVDAKRVVIYGHCDERGSRAYNEALGLHRVNSVVLALSRQSDLDIEYEVHSLGEDDPICTEHNEACWAKNRRVVIQIVR